MIFKYSFIFSILILFSHCKQSNYLDEHFNKLEQLSPPKMISEFKQLPLDSAVINNNKYNEIFVEAANIIMSDTIEEKAFKAYFENNNIKLLGRQDKWTIVAAFHKYLNKENYDIYELWEKMVELSNEKFEQQYPKPEQ